MYFCCSVRDSCQHGRRFQTFCADDVGRLLSFDKNRAYHYKNMPSRGRGVSGRGDGVMVI